MGDTVIREVVKDVWIFSRPFTRSGFVPIGGRSTAIRMKDGGVWVLASTPLNEETKARIDQMGPVRYIVGADAVHHLFLSEFKKAYPTAKLIAPQAAIDRVADKSLKFDGAWGRDPPGTRYGFEDEHCYFPGFFNKDVAFLHGESKVLIEADLLFNLPCNEQYSKVRKPINVPLIGSMGPSSWLHPRFTWRMGTDKEAMKRDVKTVYSWDFNKIIPCHGDVIESDGKKAWREAYHYFLRL
ncbi:hypothetical protein AMATHDRAFT_75598 [Amanita thiersii Skay4041]|uniref:Metallo-beta-lactamase domain-containing protein n=1 Tax=Amanita thiersii Skay4041 TaxID=703135 RepID=A0A2A9NS87_9AGAR|nr:hypothetical protein AMATHDRAFT_75598 [Amanita thiersii Skay4041]